MSQIRKKGPRPNRDGKPLREHILRVLREAGDKGITMPALFLEFQEYDWKTVQTTTCALREVHNIEMKPEGFSKQTKRVQYRYILRPPKKIEIK